MEIGEWGIAFVVGLGRVSIQLAIGIAAVLVLRVVSGRFVSRQWVGFFWWLVLARALLPFTFETGMWTVPVMEPVRTVVVTPATAPVPLAEAQHTEVLPPNDHAAILLQEASRRARKPLSTFDMLFIGWAAIALLIAVVRLLRYRRAVGRILRGARVAPSAWHPVVEDTRNAMGVRTWPVLLVSDHVPSPLLIGAIRPKIVLPASWAESLTMEDLRYFLLHEMAHLRRGDIWFGWAWFVAQSIHWFNPFVWWGGRGVRLDRELACDEVVLTQTRDADAAAYGHALLDAVSRQSTAMQGRAAIGWAGVAEDRQALERRITMIRNYNNQGKRSATLAIAAVCAVMVLCYGQLWAFADPKPVESSAEPPPPNPFAEVADESSLGGARDQAVADADLIRACEAEMRRVKLRDAENNVWKDKVDLAPIGMAFMESNDLNQKQREALIASLTAYAESHSDDPDYGWRIWQLCGVLSEGQPKVRSAYLAQAIAAYPATQYRDPAKHSKFQHLVNERALVLWDSEGQDAAEAFIVDTWKYDPRFAYFFEPVLAEHYGKVGADFAALKAKMGDKEPRKEYVLTLTTDVVEFDGKTISLEELGNTLAALDHPANCQIMIKPSRDVPVGRMVEAMETCKAAGIVTLGIAASVETK